ncbi:MAG: YbhB/YbcL family Raf kinase inhibitor-like protein [Candidatus Omnitrophota bacterium]
MSTRNFSPSATVYDSSVTLHKSGSLHFRRKALLTFAKKFLIVCSEIPIDYAKVNKIMKRLILGLIFVFIFGRYSQAVENTVSGGGVNMELTSPEFKHNEFIPAKFTCEGSDINPSLVINGIPEGAKSLALIVDDPDAPMGTWVHWVIYDIPVISTIKENSVPGKQGNNNSGKQVYHGPCPPSGTHRYFFKIYALDTKLNLNEGVSKGALEKAMKGHILGQAELIGLYKRK